MSKVSKVLDSQISICTNYKIPKKNKGEKATQYRQQQTKIAKKKMASVTPCH